MNSNPHIAIFASGNGSNAQRLTEYFTDSGKAEISAVYCNNPHAFVLERASLLGIPAVLFKRDTFYNGTSILGDLKSREVDYTGRGFHTCTHQKIRCSRTGFPKDFVKVAKMFTLRS